MAIFHYKTLIFDFKFVFYLKNWYNKVIFIFYLMDVMYQGMLNKLSWLSEARGKNCEAAGKFYLCYSNLYIISQLFPANHIDQREIMQIRPP